jgi:hypothetical protein
MFGTRPRGRRIAALRTCRPRRTLEERRGLHASTTFEGMLVLNGEADPLNGEVVSCALAAAV